MRPGYSSSISSQSTSTVSLGEGSPKEAFYLGMSSGKFTVIGGYLEKQIGNLLIQTEYYYAFHSHERDAVAISVIQNANDFQLGRFLQSNEDQSNDNLTTDDIGTNVKYNVRTWYVRLGYYIPTNVGQFIQLGKANKSRH